MKGRHCLIMGTDCCIETAVGGFHAPYPPARIEDVYLPDLDRVLEAVDRAMAY